jgi:hypothetical protein
MQFSWQQFPAGKPVAKDEGPTLESSPAWVGLANARPPTPQRICSYTPQAEFPSHIAEGERSSPSQNSAPMNFNTAGLQCCHKGSVYCTWSEVSRSVRGYVPRDCGGKMKMRDGTEILVDQHRILKRIAIRRMF